MKRKYRVTATDRNGNPVRVTHNLLGTISTGDVLELDSAVGERFVGVLLEEYRAPVKRVKRVVDGGVQEQKMDKESDD